MKHLNYYETLKAYADDNVEKYTIPTISYIKENNILKYKKDAEGLVARWKAYDKTNNDADKNILKDLSGNGHDIDLKNLSYTLGSGYGLYLTDFYTWSVNSNVSVIDHKYNSITLKVNGLGGIYTSRVIREDFNIFCEFTGVLHVKYYNGSVYKNELELSKGLNIIPKSNIPEDVVNMTFVGNTDFTLTQIPQYQGGLIFDGVNDHAICENMPIFTKEKGYTVCCIRKRLNLIKNSYLLSKSNGNISNGAFTIEGVVSGTYLDTYNFGTFTSIPTINNDNFIYQTSLSYNGEIDLKLGIWTDTNILSLASTSSTGSSASNLVFYAAELYDRTLSDAELQSVKDRMMAEWYEKAFDPAAQEYQALWTANGKTNADVDKNVPNLIDSTNPLKLRNFAYAGNSGYQLFGVNFLTWNKRTETAPYTIVTNSSIHFNKTSHLNVTNLIENSTVNLTPSFKVKVTGLTSTLTLKYISDLDGSNATIITKDGIYTLPSNNSIKYYGFKIITTDTVFPVACDVMVEQIPEGEGLYLDGVDDSFVSAKSLPALTDYTVIGDLEFFGNGGKGIAKPSNWYWYPKAIYINQEVESNIVEGVIGFNSSGLIVQSSGFINATKVGGSYSSGSIFSWNYIPLNFKSFAIIPKILDEAQIRATYDYIKTLKANNI